MCRPLVYLISSFSMLKLLAAPAEVEEVAAVAVAGDAHSAPGCLGRAFLTASATDDSLEPVDEDEDVLEEDEDEYVDDLGLLVRWKSLALALLGMQASWLRLDLMALDWRLRPPPKRHTLTSPGSTMASFSSNDIKNSYFCLIYLYTN
ncbi:hypothetical protein BpHYR1_014480 [Brachionus plicatilis]|uniref:Secreted protein n=1 Tax=Brachionus plicatilis TaxID=10195 RepID=A0A3M7R9V5_BRAPC|nr:hypothetical protein BpHYR1_014480 [Brachionus plicatilis]